MEIETLWSILDHLDEYSRILVRHKDKDKWLSVRIDIECISSELTLRIIQNRENKSFNEIIKEEFNGGKENGR